MPYIKAELRTALEFLNPMPSNAGELNYAISHMIHRYITETKKGISYANLNEVMGVLSCVDREFYATVVLPYERIKRAENGPVSDLDASDGIYERQGGDEAVQVTQVPITMDSNAILAALAKLITPPVAAETAKPRRKGKAQPAPEPAPAPAVEAGQPGLKPGETRVLSGPIPGDVGGGKEATGKTFGVPRPAGPKPPPPGPNASPGERALYAMSEGTEDEF